MKLQAILPVTLIVALATSSHAQVKNGHFELGGSGIAPPLWTEVGGVVQDPPEGAGAGGPGVNSAVFTTGVGEALTGGFLGAGIQQRFKCGPPSDQMTCFVRLDYLFDEQPAGSATKAFVYLENASGSVIAELPDNYPGGPDRVQLGLPGCGRVRIAIGLIEKNTQQEGWQSLLLVDHVVSKCDTVPFAGVTQLPATSYSPVAGTPVGDLLNALQKKMGSFQDLGGAVANPHTGIAPSIHATGTLAAGQSVSMAIEKLDPTAHTLLLIGPAEAGEIPGLVQPGVWLPIPLVATHLELTSIIPAGVAPGVDLYLQVVQVDGSDFLIWNSNKLWAVTE